MASFSVTFSNVLLTLLYLLPGFLLCRFRKVNPEHLGSFGTILLFVCGPCLFLNSLTALDPSPELTGKMLQCLVLSLLAELIVLLLLYALAGKRRAAFRWRLLALAGASGHAGFFGLPIIRRSPPIPACSAYR